MFWIKNLLLALTIVCSVVTVAKAVPVDFRFQMPLFDAFDLDGQSSTLIVTADNGNSEFANQDYLNTQILGFSVSVGELLANVSLPSFSRTTIGSQVYVRTDTFGVPTLDLTLAIDSNVVISEAPSGLGVQLGTRNFSGPSPYAVDFGAGPGFAVGVIQDGFTVVGERVVSQVPLPAGFGLLALSIAALTSLRFRRS